MSLAIKRTKTNGGILPLLSDFLAPTSSLLGNNFFDFESDFPTSRLGINVPTANIEETPREYLIELAAPGLERKDFDVKVENQTLIVSAEREEEKENKKGKYSRKEYSFNSFCRSFRLPDDVKEDNIDAKYESGVLKISIPKVKESPVAPAKKVAVS
jgi:HSP20 family protein